MKYDKAGYDRELLFRELLDRLIKNQSARTIWMQEKDTDIWKESDVDIEAYNWLSENNHTEFDFNIQTRNGWRFVDIVGIYTTKSGDKLVCKHKTWSAKFDDLVHHWHWDKKAAVDMGYLAWSDGNEGLRWNFLKIHNQLPKGDVLLTSARKRKILNLYEFFMGYEDVCEFECYADDVDTIALQRKHCKKVNIYSPPAISPENPDLKNPDLKITPVLSPTPEPITPAPVPAPVIEVPVTEEPVFEIVRPVVLGRVAPVTNPRIFSSSPVNPVSDYYEMLRSKRHARLLAREGYR